MKNATKIILSVAVLGLFALYSLHERSEGSEVNISPTQQQLQQSQSQNNSSQDVSPTPTIAVSGRGFKDGTYTGTTADAFYGPLQVKATISGGKISDIEFIQYPNDRETSIQISNQSMPILKSEAIQNQTAKVDNVTGATQTSEAFVQTLQSALDQAKG
jgi:uncharacterized protein with FMN-binding domain